MIKQPNFSDLEYARKKKTIRRDRFRHRLKKERLITQRFQEVEDYLAEYGLIVNEGTIVDAKIIEPVKTGSIQNNRQILMGTLKIKL